MNKNKPLGRKNYGHIPHLPGSRMGPSDHKCSEGQARIATEKKRDKHDRIIVTEKLDGSNVGVCKKEGCIIPLTRAGYWAKTSPFQQHKYFARWVAKNWKRFDLILGEGERICGEWLLQAHGTRYDLGDIEPFAIFDIFDKNNNRYCEDDAWNINTQFAWVPKISIDNWEPMSIETAIKELTKRNPFNAIDKREGVVWRVERNKIINKSTGERKKVVDFLVKYVRPDKKDGIYLSEVSGKDPVWNCNPSRI